MAQTSLTGPRTKWNNMKILLTLLTITGLLFFAPGCKKEQKMGTMEIKMTDSPGDFDGLFVKIVKVEAYSGNTGWIVLSETATSVDVLTLTNGADITLAHNTNIQPGTYTQLRLTFGTDNQLSYNDGSGSTIFDLDLDFNSVIEIPIQAQITSGNSTSILLDFNVAFSLVQTGNQFHFEPMISQIVDPATGVGGHIYGSNSAVTVVGEGRKYSTYTDTNGNFLLRGVKDGNYTINIDPRGTQDLTVIQNVEIAKGRITRLGSLHTK